MSPSGSDALDQLPSIYGSRQASLTLDVIVVCSGIGSLSATFRLTQTGHRLTIVESSPELGQTVGTGILSTPNCSRLLRGLGLGKCLDELSVRLGKGPIIRGYNTSEQIGFMKWGDVMKDYGAPYHQVHRSDLQKMLYKLVAPHVTIFLGSPVVGCDPDQTAPSVTLESGKVLNADFIYRSGRAEELRPTSCVGGTEPSGSNGPCCIQDARSDFAHGTRPRVA